MGFILLACFFKDMRKNIAANIPSSNGLSQRLDGIHRRRSVGLRRRDLCSLGGVGHACRRRNLSSQATSNPYQSIQLFFSTSCVLVDCSSAVLEVSDPKQARRIDFGRLAPRALAEATQSEVKAMQQRKE